MRSGPAASRQPARSASSGSPSAQRVAYRRRNEELVRNSRNLLGFAPRVREARQLAVKRDALGLLVRRHLEREAVLHGQARESMALELWLRGRPAKEMERIAVPVED